MLVAEACPAARIAGIEKEVELAGAGWIAVLADVDLVEEQRHLAGAGGERARDDDVDCLPEIGGPER